MATLEQMLTDKNSELTDNFGQMADKEQELSQLRDRLAAVTALLSERDADIDRLKAVIAESEDHQRAADMRAQLDRQTAAVATLEATVSVHEIEKLTLISKLETAELSAQTAAERTASLKAQIHELEVVWSAREKQLEGLLSAKETETARALSELNNTLAEQSEKMAELETKIVDREQKLAERSALVESLGKELKENAAKAVEHKEKMEALNDDFTGKVEQLTCEIAASREEMAALQSELELKTGDVAALNEDMLAKYQIIEDLQQEVDQAKNEGSKEVGQLQQQLEEGCGKIAQLQQQLEHEREEGSSRAAQLQQQIEEGVMHSAQLEKQLEEDSSRSAHLKEQAEQLRNELEQTFDKVAELTGTVEQLRADLQQEKSAAVALRKELASKVGRVKDKNRILGCDAESSHFVLATAPGCQI